MKIYLTVLFVSIIGTELLLTACDDKAFSNAVESVHTSTNPTATPTPVSTPEETIAQKAQNLKRIEQSFKQELANYLKGRFKYADLRMAGDPKDPDGFVSIPADVIGILLKAEDFGSFTETQLSAFAKKIGLYYLIKNPYVDSCQVEIYPELFVNEWARITRVERHENMQKEYADLFDYFNPVQKPLAVSTQHVQPSSVNDDDDKQLRIYLKSQGYSATPKEIEEVRAYMKSHGLPDPWKMGPLMDDDDKLTGYLKAHGNTEVTQNMIDQLRGYMSAHGLHHIAELSK